MKQEKGLNPERDESAGHGARVPLSPLLKRYKFVFDLVKRVTDDYVCFIDMDTHRALVSPNFVHDFHVPAESLADFTQYWLPLIHPEERRQCEQHIDSFFHKSGSVDLYEFNDEYRVKSGKGDYIWVRVRGRLGSDRDGSSHLFVAILRRMGYRNQADDVTGLLNKYQFEHAVKVALNAFRIAGQGGAVMIFGIDNFKLVNETSNRVLGDAVLKNIARLIEGVLPTGLMLYKLDGDEYAVVYPGAGEKEATTLFSDVQKALSRPQRLEGRTYFCTASAGTVFYPQGGKDYLVLHKHAEAAMDLAKRDGKNRNCIFSKEQYNRWVRSISLRDYLRRSVEQGFEGFSLCYQPQVEAGTGRLLGAEALLRYKNPKGRMVAPMEFIPLLEDTKLILPVGKWIFETALRTCRKWRQILPNFRMSINMSYDQVKDLSFRDFVHDCLAHYNMPPGSVILELTESKIVADWNFVNAQFDTFREKGVSIAMDDFGTGYSSLSSLKNLSCDIVKIDREFVKSIEKDNFDEELVKSVVSLCHRIGITTCIEGVEEHEAYELLTKECAADVIQGYLFGRPETMDVFEEKYLTQKESLPYAT